MRNPLPITLLVCSVLVPLGVFTGCETTRPTAPTPHELTLQRTRRDLAILADDRMEGRGVNTQGINRAAEFLANELKSAGLKTVRGADGYFQHFSMRGESSIAPTTRLEIGGESVPLDTRFRPNGITGTGTFRAPVAFVGYAIDNAAAGYNDFDGIDLKGRVALALRYEPHDASGKSRFDPEGWSDASTLTAKAEAVARAGGVALLLVNPPEHHGKEDNLQAFTRRARSAASIPVIQITRDAADQLLSKGGVRDLKTLQSLIDAEFKPASAALDDSLVVAGTIDIDQKMIPVKNVLAALPGQGWDADEWIVVGAHYDHLGFGGRGALPVAATTQSISHGATSPATGPTTRSVYNGADDNGSGTAAVLELARRLKERNRPLKRSVLFIFFTGEESGLYGSAHFVNNPLVPLDKVVAMLNLDMVGRVKDNQLFVGGRETAAAFERITADADTASPLKFDKITGRATYASDHASFMGKQIPTLFFFSGLHVDYHRPTDDVEKINFNGIADVVDVSVDTVLSLAVMGRQKYRGPSTLPASATQPAGPATAPATPTGGRPQLGLIPSYGDDSIEGVKIDGTVPGTAAADAGLLAGDIIKAINGRKLPDLDALQGVLEGAKIGDVLNMTVLRGKDTVELKATLRPRREE